MENVLNMRRRFALAILCCLPAACTGAGTQSQSASGPADELRIETWAIPRNLNPIFSTNTSENFLAGLAFDELVTNDPHGNDVPDLAAVVPTVQNGGISGDGKTIVYHLRRSVQWHDGAPFTSQDVKFSWQAVMNSRNNVVERRGYDEVRSVDTPDPYTVVFHLKEPFAPFVNTVFGESDDPFRVIPSHLLAKYADLNQVPFNTQPVGTGPFRVTRFIQGEEIDYSANGAYFRGKPHIAKIVVHFVTDHNTRETDLRSGVSDLANDVAPTIIRDVRNDKQLGVVMAESPQFLALEMNMAHPPLDDLRVRQAIASAIDKNAIIRNDTYGTADPATEDLSHYYWAYDGQVPQIPLDRARSAQLLDAAGWKMGPAGIRMKDGQPLSFVLEFERGQPTFRVVGVQVQSDLRAVGIDVQIKQIDPTMLYATVAAGGILMAGKFDLVLYPWIAGADPDDSQQWTCRYVPPNGNNITHFCNPAMDAAEHVAMTNVDRASRKAAYARTQLLLAQNEPADFLYYYRRLYVINPRLKNFDPNGVSEGWNAYEWSL
jgi:peptide/nickel transport system substrate-binding protein